jgi:hypothetical protein
MKNLKKELNALSQMFRDNYFINYAVNLRRYAAVREPGFFDFVREKQTSRNWFNNQICARSFFLSFFLSMCRQHRGQGPGGANRMSGKILISSTITDAHPKNIDSIN